MQLLSDKSLETQRKAQGITYDIDDLNILLDPYYIYDIDHINDALAAGDDRQLVEIPLEELSFEEQVELRRRAHILAQRRTADELTTTPGSMEFSDVELARERYC